MLKEFSPTFSKGGDMVMGALADAEFPAVKALAKWSTTRPAQRPRAMRAGRYPLKLRNASDDIHPVHLHRHSFELTYVHGEPTTGVTKDVVMLGGYQELAVDFTADNPGDTLLHCHQQLHMDYGFMALFNTLEAST